MFNFLKPKKEQQLESICINILASEWLIKQYQNLETLTSSDFYQSSTYKFPPNLTAEHKIAASTLTEKLWKIVTLNDLYTNFLRPNTGLIRNTKIEYKGDTDSKAIIDNQVRIMEDDDGKIYRYQYEDVEILLDGKSFDPEENINHSKLIDSFNKSEIELIEAADLHLSIWEKGLHPYNFKTTLLCNQEFHSSLKSFFENELTKSEMDSMKFYNKNFRELLKVQFSPEGFNIPNDSYIEDNAKYYESFDEKFIPWKWHHNKNYKYKEDINGQYLVLINQCKL